MKFIIYISKKVIPQTNFSFFIFFSSLALESSWQKDTARPLWSSGGKSRNAHHLFLAYPMRQYHYNCRAQLVQFSAVRQTVKYSNKTEVFVKGGDTVLNFYLSPLLFFFFFFNSISYIIIYCISPHLENVLYPRWSFLQYQYHTN